MIESNYALAGKEITIKDGFAEKEVFLYLKEIYKRFGYEDVDISLDEDKINIFDAGYGISEIQITGNLALSADALIKILDLKRKLIFSGWKIEGKSLIRGLQNIRTHYHNNGRPRVNIKSGVNNHILHINIDEGVLVRVLETNIKSDITNIELFDRITSEFDGGKIYSRMGVDSVLSDIKNYLDNNGYVDGVINVENKEIGDNGVILEIDIIGGKVYTFGNITMDGWGLDSKYQYRYLHSGNIYSLDAIRHEVRSLNNKQLFKSIIPDVTKTGDLVDINIRLTKKKTGIILGGATLTGSNPNVYLRVREDNFFNKGIVADFSLSGNNQNLELLSMLTFDDNSELTFKVNDFATELDVARKYTLGWRQQKDKLIGLFYGVNGVLYDGCMGCGEYGVEVNIGLRWSQVDDYSNPLSGSVGYIEAIGIFNENKNSYFANLQQINYLDLGNNVIFKNNLFASVGINGDYFSQEPNAFVLRGIDNHGLQVNDNTSILFKDKIDVYKKVDMFDKEVIFGPYLDVIGTRENIGMTKYIAGGAVSLETGVGMLELYYGIPFDKHSTLDSVGGIILNNRF